MFSSAFGAYQSDCPVLKIDVSIHVASPMIVYENHDPTKRIFTSTTKSPNVKPPYFCAATITSFRIAVAYSSSIHVNCSAQPIATFSLQLLLVFIIVSEFRPIQGVAKIYVAEKTLRRRASTMRVHLHHGLITSKASPRLSTIESEANSGEALNQIVILSAGHI
jgi:hypothetical protein